MLNRISKNQRLRKFSCYGIALLVIPGGQPHFAQSNSVLLYVEVISKDTRKPLESTIEIHKDGSWTPLGVTSSGKFRKRFDCSEIGMLRANPKDKAYRRSTPVQCAQEIEITLTRVGRSSFASIEKDPCPDSLQAYSSIRQHTLASRIAQYTTFNQLVETSYLKNDRPKPEPAKPIWVRTKVDITLRALPDDRSQSAFAVIAGTELIPTNNSSGDWWEVSDKGGSISGWLKESMFDMVPGKFGKPNTCDCTIEFPETP